jgi:hypothetical protein
MSLEALERGVAHDDAPPAVGPTIGGPTASSWREQALTRIAELEDLTEVLVERTGRRGLLAVRIDRHLQTARQAAEGKPRRARWTAAKASLGGSELERTASNIDAAEANLLRLAPPEYLEGQMPSLLAHVRGHLAADDPRRKRLEQLAARRDKRFGDAERDSIVATVRAASSAARREVVQVRSFRSVLLVAATFLTVAAIAVAAVGFARPDIVPLCFNPPGKIACPTTDAAVKKGADVDQLMRDSADDWDILTIELFGLIAAGLASAAALRNIRGTTTPYSLPVALALLKLPSGALTAVLGLLLMRGNFVPGLSALDTPAQIIAWAIIFGYAQQIFTRFVDARAHTVLDEVGTPAGAGPGRPSTA